MQKRPLFGQMQSMILHHGDVSKMLKLGRPNRVFESGHQQLFHVLLFVSCFVFSLDLIHGLL